jgi:hypothetical protein
MNYIKYVPVGKERILIDKLNQLEVGRIFKSVRDMFRYFELEDCTGEERMVKIRNLKEYFLYEKVEGKNCLIVSKIFTEEELEERYQMKKHSKKLPDLNH